MAECLNEKIENIEIFGIEEGSIKVKWEVKNPSGGVTII